MRKENLKKNQRKLKEKGSEIAKTTTVENDERNLSGTEKKGKMVAEHSDNDDICLHASDEDIEYEVEAVVDHKVENGISYFLIKWKGYDASSSTWEPENTLSCPDLIAKFKKRAKRPMSKGRKPRKRSKHDPSQEWEVEKIIDAVTDKNGGHIFRIRWKGYKPSSDTWEPEANLNCGNLIEKFLKKRGTEEATEHKELREAPKRTNRFVQRTFGRRFSKRNSGKSRAVYFDAE